MFIKVSAYKYINTDSIIYFTLNNGNKTLSIKYNDSSVEMYKLTKTLKEKFEGVINGNNSSK